MVAANELAKGRLISGTEKSEALEIG